MHPEKIPRELPREKASGSFEQAILAVKANSPGVKKYFQLDEDSRLVIRGDCEIDGKIFLAIYDLGAADRNPGGGFRIPFLVEDAGAGVFSSDHLFWSPAEDETGLLLSFDDDYWQTWEKYFDLFDRFNARVTFFVQGAYQPAAHNAGSAGRGIADFCAEALGRGHDTGYHSVNHLDLTKVSREEFDSETSGGAENFLNAGIPFSAFAYPFGFSRPWMRDALAHVFALSRGYGVRFRLYDLEAIKEGYIVSKAIDNIIYPNDDDFERNIRLMLLAAKFIGGVIPFTTHDISDSAQWGIKPGRLEFLLETAKELKLKFYTFGDLLRLHFNGS
jgi:peptidoglycan/xylan/chitin deacetylase (PgdA/CDA1 family)